MTLLQIMADSDAAAVRLHTNDAALINAELADRGIAFEHWPIADGLAVGRPADQILADYAEPVAAINRDGRYRHIDVTGLASDDGDPGWQATATTARSKFPAATIRFFEREDRWIGEFTGDAIGERFPTLDQLVGA